MSRMQINTLTSLVDTAEAGGWTLPADVLEAHRIYRQVSALDLETTAALDAYTAAAGIVSATTAGEPVDPLAGSYAAPTMSARPTTRPGTSCKSPPTRQPRPRGTLLLTSQK